MNQFFKVILTLLFLSSSALYSQKKTVEAKSISEKISINGELDENIWNTAKVATDFVMLEPDNGVPIAPEKKTDVRILYDNEAIYVSALLYDNQPGLILREMTQRDNFGTADHFGVYINGFNDGQQDFRFYVSAAGVQMDCIATETNEDYSWDAIWSSNVNITDFGWVVEMRIPYAALRFSKEDKQTWGLNLYREIKRDRQKYTWSPIDMKIGATLPQAGLLEGIENIEPPVRLFFIPYASYYHERNESTSNNTFKAGMDIKYGINDSFTLDAILVPDFGQTVYDNVQLNLGPFEQQFNENRPFFTEGTDLFNKGGLLYSRRIGGSPSTYASSENPDEEVKNPTSVNLINALKISGRTSKGLGIGFLNAVTEQTFATVNNNASGESRKVEVEPLSNYNVFVLDQRFNQNSSVAFVNTNVTRNGDYRDANVSALVYDLNTTNNKFNLSGDFKYSYINELRDFEDQKGINTTLGFAKKGGNWRYSIGGNYVSDEYDSNDLGIIFINNYHGGYGNFGYRILNPSGIFNTFKINSNYYLEFQNTTGKAQQAQINIDVTSTTRKNDYFSYALYINPFETYDFYEARTSGRFVNLPKNVYNSLYFSSNYNRPFALDLNLYGTVTNETDRSSYGITVAPRYRANDRLLFNLSLDMFKQFSDKGWIAFDSDDIIFSERNRQTITIQPTAKYAISPTMTINLSARYYWSYAQNKQFLTLQERGELAPNTTFAENTNSDLNDWNSDFSTWNFDLSYSWWFAPGSQLSVLYRNNALNYSNVIEKRFLHNANNLFENNLNNIFSVSFRYFIDYNSIKNAF